MRLKQPVWRWLAGFSAAASAFAWPIRAQSLVVAEDSGPSALRVLGALLLCLLLAGGAALALRSRLGLAPLPSLGVRPGRRLRLVEALRLNAQTQLCIVSCDDRELLVTADAAGARILQLLPAATTVVSGET